MEKSSLDEQGAVDDVQDVSETVPDEPDVILVEEKGGEPEEEELSSTNLESIDICANAIDITASVIGDGR